MNKEHQMEYERLKKQIEASPNKELTVWFISIEDVYETAFGDGKYVYRQKAFLSYDVAARWVNWISNRPYDNAPFTPYKATISCEVLRLGPGGIIMSRTPRSTGELSEMPFTEFERLKDDYFGWVDVIKFCSEISNSELPTWNHTWS